MYKLQIERLSFKFPDARVAETNSTKRYSVTDFAWLAQKQNCIWCDLLHYRFVRIETSRFPLGSYRRSSQQKL